MSFPGGQEFGQSFLKESDPSTQLKRFIDRGTDQTRQAVERIGFIPNEVAKELRMGRVNANSPPLAPR